MLKNLFRLTLKPIFPNIVRENFKLVSVDTAYRYAYFEVDGYDNTLAVNYTESVHDTWAYSWVFECVTGEPDPCELGLPDGFAEIVLSIGF